MKAIKTRRVAALGATCALAAAGMFGAMAANADEESMSGGQSGSEQSGGNGGEEGQSGGNGGEEGQSGGTGGEEGQSGGEEGQSGGEEGGETESGGVIDSFSIVPSGGNVLDTKTSMVVTWMLSSDQEDEDEDLEPASLRAASDFIVDSVTVDAVSVDFACGDVTEYTDYGYAMGVCELDVAPAMAGYQKVVATSGDFTATGNMYRSIVLTSDLTDGELTQQECSPADVTYTIPADQVKYLPEGTQLILKAWAPESSEPAAEATVSLTDGKAVVALDPASAEDPYNVSVGLFGADDVKYGGLYFEMTVEPGCAATGGLAQTGANAGWVALAALATIGAGAGAVAINRRRA